MCKEAALVEDKVAKAHRVAVIAREVARTTKDVATTTANNAQDIGLQVNFKVLRQALLQMAPDFNVEALDALVTMKMVDAIVLEAKVEHEAGRVVVGGRDLVGQIGGIIGASGAAIEEIEAIEALFAEAHLVPIKGDSNLALAEDDTRPAEMMSAETAS